MSKSFQIPIFDISVDGDGLGMFGLSFVDAPATQVEMHVFKADESDKAFYFSNKEKREVVAPVLIPNQLIFREADGFNFYMRASEETIRKIYEKYMLSGNWNNFTYLHQNMELDMSERTEDGIYLQRLWIIEDEKEDDANCKYGFSLPKGTLMMKAKVNNRQIWNEIKEGKLRGISLEAFFDKINTNKALQITYSKMKSNLELFQKFIAFLNEVSVEAEEIADEAKKDETNSGEVELKYYLDDTHYLTVDGEGFVRDEDYNLVAEGEYRLADSNIIVVDANGKFVMTKAVAEDENKVEAPIAEAFEEEEKKDEEDAKEDVDEDEKPLEEADGEDDGDAAGTGGESDAVDDKETGEDGTEEDDKKDEELEEEEPLVNAIPYEINGIDYLLPPEVVDYIESLKTSKVEVEEKLTQMAEQTPTAKPIGTVVKNADGGDDINDRISMLNSFRGFRRRG